MKKLTPPNKAISHEWYGAHKRVRLGIYRGGIAFVAVKATGRGLRLTTHQTLVFSGPVDEMRDVAERLGRILDDYSAAAGIKLQAECV